MRNLKKQHNLSTFFVQSIDIGPVIGMGKKTQEKSVAFFERNSWYHRTKALQDNGIVKYGKKGGFSSQAEAEASVMYH